MTNSARPCPICKLDAHIDRAGNRDAFEIECRRCRRFVMTATLMTVMERLNAEDQRLLPYLSAHTRQATENGILTELHTDNWQDLARAHTKTSVSQKAKKLLAHLAAHSIVPGAAVQIDSDLDYPLFDAGAPGELRYLLDHLVDLGSLQRVDARTFVVTVKGWERLEPPAGGSGISGRCFVAMSFDPTLNDAYERGIRPAVIDCGFEPIRIDRVHHNEKICDKILAEIRLAQLVVADFTLQRAGVYFEGGFAMALGRPVIWMCREDDFENTHFDTRQYNHIVWSTPDDLRTKLTDRICATVTR